ncbi:MAG: histidine kinase [Chitinophagaceae bacterium]
MKLQKDNTSHAGLLAMPLLIGFLTFVLLASMCAYLAYQRYTIVRNEERENAQNIAESVRSRLQQVLQYSLSATQAMTLLIDKQGVAVNFDSIAPYIFKAHKYIDALELVPGGVISHVYPETDNEAALGYNILQDPNRNKEAYKAIEKRKLFFAGPFKLKQGGIGIVGRLPVFINDKFWGFSAVIIRLTTLLKAAGIDTIGINGYYFQLSKINPDTKKEEFFLPFRGFSAKQYEVGVSVPDGEWKLSIMPVNGYKSFQAVIPVALLGFVLSLLGAIFAMYASRTPAHLRQLVAQRTAELYKSENRNKAIVNALPDMVFVINQEGRFLDFNNPTGNKTLMTPDQFISKKVPEILPEPLASEVMVCIEKTLQTGQILSYSYQMEIDNETRSYESRYIPQTNDDVLVIVRDTTEARKVEKALLNSREELRQLSNHLEDVREEERLHIAREIHDELGQHLTVLKMNFSFLEKNILETNSRFSPELSKIMDLINDMMKAVRKISHELRPGLLDELGLVSALEWYSNDFEKKTGIRTSFITDFSDSDLPDKIRTGLFRIFQESLTNIARHAEAKRVDASLNLQEKELVLLIEDDGIGFNTATVEHRKTLGIVGMRERAIMMGGTYNIHSAPGKGTIVDVVIPFSNS